MTDGTKVPTAGWGAAGGRNNDVAIECIDGRFLTKACARMSEDC